MPYVQVTHGLKIIDVSSKANPILVGDITLLAQDVTVVDNYAYIADLCGGLQIVDLSNKASPVNIGSVATSNALGVVVVDNYAYVADFGGGLKIIDVSNKTSPINVASVATRMLMASLSLAIMPMLQMALAG